VIPRSTHRHRGWLGQLGLLLFGCAIALVLAEGLLFIRGRGRCGGGQAPLWRPDRVVGWALVPGKRADVAVCRPGTDALHRTVVINALGQRDRARTYGRPAGRQRVLVLGDSFVEAIQVELEETFTARLEERLRIEMLNAGVSGYSTDNELRAFVSRGARYAPDAVVLVFHVGNDVLENGARLYLENPHGLPPKPWLTASDATPALARCLAVHRAIARLAAATPALVWDHSRIVRGALTSGVETLAYACANAVGPPLIPGVPDLLGVYGAPATPAWTEAWDTTAATLVELAGRVRATGARFAVVLSPAGLEIDSRLLGWHILFAPVLATRTWDYAYPYERLGAVLDRAGIPWMSLVPALRAHYDATGRSGYYSWDAHWDAEGHAVVASALEPFVRSLVDADPY
jgi:hypothetical protein